MNIVVERVTQNAGAVVEFTSRVEDVAARSLIPFVHRGNAVDGKPVPYKGLVGGHRSLGNQM